MPHSSHDYRRWAFLWWTFILLYLAVILLAARRPEFATDAIREAIGRLWPRLSFAQTAAATFYLRRFIHFAGYFLITIILIRALTATAGRRQAGLGIIALAVILALCIAILDETLQTRFPARTGRPSDVLLDGLGGTVGALAVVWRQKRRKKRA